MKAIILISDGQTNVGEISQILDYVSINNLTIHTFAVGTQSGGSTSADYISKTDLDFLKSLAFNSRGRFFEFETLDDLTANLNDFVTETTRDVDLRADFYLTISSLVLFFILMTLINFRFRTIP